MRGMTVLTVGVLIIGLSAAIATIIYSAGPFRSPATEEILRRQPPTLAGEKRARGKLKAV
jgi:hypothetical protein